MKPTFFNESAENEKIAIRRHDIAMGDIPGMPKWNSFLQLENDT